MHRFIVKNESTKFFMVCTPIDHRNDVIKCSKLGSEITRLRLVVPFEFITFHGAIFVVFKSAEQEKLWSICCTYLFGLILNDYLSAHTISCCRLFLWRRPRLPWQRKHYYFRLHMPVVECTVPS